MKNSAGKQLLSLAAVYAILMILFVLSSCTPSAPTTQPETSDRPEPGKPVSYLLPTQDGKWSPPVQQNGRKPTEIGKIHIEGVGEFPFDAGQVKTLRPDIFQPGHFSV